MSRRKSSHTGLKVVLILLILALIAATVYVVKLCMELTTMEADTDRPQSTIQLPQAGAPDTEATEVPTETTEPEPVPEHVVSTATVGAVGDLLMHMPIFDDQVKYNAAVQQADGSYDFTSVFQYITEYISSLDFAVANLETTLAGTDNGYAYSGFPLFNCPDEIVDGAMNAGFDLLLTANNHCYDTKMTGLTRTLEVIREKGLPALGTRLSEEEPRYTVVDVNGIRIGMFCYTFTTSMNNGKPSLNGNTPVEQPELVNYFSYGNLEKFYSDVEQILADMEAEGAEATMLYIHWGTEKELTENSYQNTIAQKLCDLGIDVIVGGHPHVIQPMELLESAVDPDHKTVCIYSVGNFVSNQRRQLMSLQTGHTEDGALFRVTFEKYSDGTVYLAETDVLPTWVNMHDNDSGKTEYNILPLDYDCLDQWQTLYGLTDAVYTETQNSYNRTMDIIGEGLTECQTYLAQQKQAREDFYYDLAYHPEKYAAATDDAA